MAFYSKMTIPDPKNLQKWLFLTPAWANNPWAIPEFSKNSQNFAIFTLLEPKYII